MTHLLKILPLLAALTAAPAFAAQADPHAGHHPATAAETPKATAPTPPASATDAKPAMQGCPMMDGKMSGDAGPMAGKGPEGKMMDGKMMMDGKAMHCMPAPAAAKGAEATRDHEHPAPAPK